MTDRAKPFLLYAVMACLMIAVGLLQSWSLSLTILNLCLISAIMALGVNIQWGYAGLFNIGIMGFAALGGLAAVLVSMPPVPGAWEAGGAGIGLSLLATAATVAAVIVVRARTAGLLRTGLTFAMVIAGFFVARSFYVPATQAITSHDAAATGYLGGLGLPIMASWLVGGAFAAGAAWVIGKIALGLRADYLAIATLGISEIVIAVLKAEEWLTRGVKNVTGLPTLVPSERELRVSDWFISLSNAINVDPQAFAGNFVKMSHAVVFSLVLLALIWLSEKALKSPWGRMMRAIRDNRDAAEAMGKAVTARHLQVFVIGSAVVGLAGAMLVTLDGQFTPTSYIPLRYTFLIWVMVIVGGSGNNWGAVLGGFLIWFLWVEVEPVGAWLMSALASGFNLGPDAQRNMLDAAPYMRPLLMGLVLLLTLRFSPRGLIPERGAKSYR